MQKINRLKLENKAWAQGIKAIDPNYFAEISKGQSPEILWIGCSDSRISLSALTNTVPGELFVHRNIANNIREDDANMMSVLEFAIKYLKVNHIIVCGHTRCGGVQAAFDGIDNPVLSNWINNISELKFSKKPANAEELVDLNVKSQIETLKNLPIIKEAWSNGHKLDLIGMTLELETGLLREVDAHYHSQS